MEEEKKKPPRFRLQISKTFSLILITTFLSHNLATTSHNARLPGVFLVDALECKSDDDCGTRDKICHENKCICSRERPVETDEGRCVNLALIGEACEVNEQCMGNSECIEATCSCGNAGISLFNPSAKIYYCHPKRRLNEECNHDSQCPSNSYCSNEKSGCLCHNGFGQAFVNNGTFDVAECLPKICSVSGTCDQEYHFCEDNKCKCDATHWDPETAKCYKFGSFGEKIAQDMINNVTSVRNNITDVDTDDFYSILKDLISSERGWLILIITISIVLLILLMAIRKHYLGYCCWTAHKKEYEPNNKNAPKNGYFNKNSINNKSFRRKDNELDDDQQHDNSSEDRSNLVDTKKGSQCDHVRVNMNATNEDTSDHLDESKHYQASTPLKSSTSTPV